MLLEERQWLRRVIELARAPAVPSGRWKTNHRSDTRASLPWQSLQFKIVSNVDPELNAARELVAEVMKFEECRRLPPDVPRLRLPAPTDVASTDLTLNDTTIA